MIETKTAPYDVAEFLETPEEMAAYLEACIQESDGDAAFIAKALGDIARAKGMTQHPVFHPGFYQLLIQPVPPTGRLSPRRPSLSSAAP
jgi:hypothetical protein